MYLFLKCRSLNNDTGIAPERSDTIKDATAELSSVAVSDEFIPAGKTLSLAGSVGLGPRCHGDVAHAGWLRVEQVLGLGASGS